MTSSSSIRPSLEKLFALCERNLYSIPPMLNVERVSGTRGRLMMPLNGPCGDLLKRNILNEWWHSLVTASAIPTFPVPALAESKHDKNKTRNDSSGHCSMSNVFSAGCLKFFPTILQFADGRLPCALVKHGPHAISGNSGLENFVRLDMNDANASSESVECDSCADMTLVTSQSFVNPKTGLQWFNSVQRQRLAWWKKFSSMPTSFHLADVKTPDEESQLIEIQFQLPCGDVRTVEQLFNHGSRPVQQLALSSDISCQVKDGRKSIFPCVIECLMSIDAAASVFFMDAFREKKSLSGEMRLILTLHQRLTPYKVSFAIASCPGTGQLKNVANYIVKELRKNNVSLLFLPDLSLSPLEHQFMKYDEIGIPYCIVLNELTLKNGIIGVRNRDTTLKEQVHVSEIVCNITKYVSSY